MYIFVDSVNFFFWQTAYIIYNIGNQFYTARLATVYGRNERKKAIEKRIGSTGMEAGNFVVKGPI